MKKCIYLLLAVIITMPLFGTIIFANDKKPATVNKSTFFVLRITY